MLAGWGLWIGKVGLQTFPYVGYMVRRDMKVCDEVILDGCLIDHPFLSQIQSKIKDHLCVRRACVHPEDGMSIAGWRASSLAPGLKPLLLVGTKGCE
jgi:hypothetical protein